MSEATKRARMLGQVSASLWTLLAAVTLATVGILAIQTVAPDYAVKQLQWLVISLGVAVLVALPHPKAVNLAAYPMLVVTTLLLVVLLIPFMPASFVPVRNGARSWMTLHFMSFQPSELAKIAFVLALARYLRFRDNYRTLLGLLVPFVIMFVPVVLILKEPDLGSAALFAPALFFVLVAAGAKLRHLGALVGLALLAIGLNIAVIYMAPDSMQILKPHQRDRIKSMVSQAQGDTKYVQNIGFQQDKAVTLIGAGGMWGYGQDRSARLVRLNALPEDHNDMIFVVIVNRWGVVGGLMTIGLFAILILSILVVSARSKDPFARLACVGFAGLLLSQVTINVGMTLGLLPITGITLPLVSYGGSSLLATFIMVGLVINFGTARPTLISRPSFEYDESGAVTE